MAPVQNEIDSSQSLCCQPEVNLFERLTITILRAERDSFCNRPTFRGSKSAEGPAKQRQQFDELHLVQLADPFVQQTAQLGIMNQEQCAVGEKAIHPSRLVCGRNSSG